MKEGIIRDVTELKSFTLSSEELIVNGVKQPAAVHQKIRDKLVKRSRWMMQYNAE